MRAGSELVYRRHQLAGCDWPGAEVPDEWSSSLVERAVVGHTADEHDHSVAVHANEHVESDGPCGALYLRRMDLGGTARGGKRSDESEQPTVSAPPCCRRSTRDCRRGLAGDNSLDSQCLESDRKSTRLNSSH